METYFREVGLCHLEQVSALSEEHIAAIFVDCHILELTAFEVFEFGWVVRFNPACFEERHRFPTALCAILVEEAVFDYFELELTYSTNDFAVVGIYGKNHDQLTENVSVFRLFIRFDSPH